MDTVQECTQKIQLFLFSFVQIVTGRLYRCLLSMAGFGIFAGNNDTGMRDYCDIK
jgi:hypothetical protein